MENTEKIKMFLNIVKEIGDYEDLYIPCLYYNNDNPDKPFIINTIKNKSYFLSAREVRLFNKLKNIKVEELNREVNILRQQREEEEILLARQQFEERKNKQEEKFWSDYNNFYNSEE